MVIISIRKTIDISIKVCQISFLMQSEMSISCYTPVFDMPPMPHLLYEAYVASFPGWGEGLGTRLRLIHIL